MRVFVTGAGGFVGRRLRKRLARAGHEAIGADREVDVTDPSRVRQALRAARPDAVVHLAAMSSVALSWREPEACFRLNVLGTRSVLAATEAEAPTARLLLVGSADQYSPVAPEAMAAGPAGSTTVGFDETTPLRPRSPYARSKAAAERLGEAYAERGGDVVRVRAFNHTGAGQSDAFVASSFARQIAAIRAGRQAPRLRVGNLESVRDFLHVDDVLDAYLALLEPSVPAAIYNVASGRATRIQDLLDRLMELAGVEAEVETDPDRFRPTDWLVGNADRLRAATGWQPKIALDRLLEELLADWHARDAAA